MFKTNLYQPPIANKTITYSPIVPVGRYIWRSHAADDEEKLKGEM